MCMSVENTLLSTTVMPAAQLKGFWPFMVISFNFLLVFCDLFSTVIVFSLCHLTVSNSTSYSFERITRSPHDSNSFHTFTHSVYLRKKNPSQSSCLLRQVATPFCMLLCSKCYLNSSGKIKPVLCLAETQ